MWAHSTIAQVRSEAERKKDKTYVIMHISNNLSYLGVYIPYKCYCPTASIDQQECAGTVLDDKRFIHKEYEVISNKRMNCIYCIHD